MAYVSGTAGSVAFVSGGTSVINGAMNWDMSIEMETPETTAFGDSWGNYLPGIRRWTGTLELIKDPASGPQGTVQSLIIGGSAAIVFRFYELSNFYAGSAYVSGGAPGISYDDKAVTSYDLTGHGPLTYT